MATGNEIMAVANALMSDLVKLPKHGGEHGCLLMFMPRYPDNVCVKGHIDLTSFAEAAIDALDAFRRDPEQTAREGK